MGRYIRITAGLMSIALLAGACSGGDESKGPN